MTNSKQTEAMKLALEGAANYIDALGGDSRKYRQALAEQPAQPQQEPVSDRENSIIRFALHQFMSNAYAHLTAAAQDKEGKRYPSEAVEKFAKDAEDAQALLKRLQFTSPPAQRTWVGLTDEDKCTVELAQAEVDPDWIDGYKNGLKDAEDKLKEKNA